MKFAKLQIRFTIGETLIMVVGLLIATIMFIASKNALNLSVYYTPLIDAAMDIKLEVVLARDVHDDFHQAHSDEVNYMLRHLKLAQWYADSMLDGGKDEGNIILALKDETQHQQIQQVKSNIHKIIGFITKNESLFSSTEGRDKILTAEFKDFFTDTFNRAELVEVQLLEEFKDNLKIFRIARISLIVTVVIFSIISLLVYRRVNYHRRMADLSLNESRDLYRRSQEQLQYVINGANLGFWDWNYQTGEHQVNDRWLEILGLQRLDIKNRVEDWESRIHPDDKQRIFDNIEQHIKTGLPYVIELRMRHKDGHWVWIQGSGAVVEYDYTHQVVRICGTHQDISERKKMEERLSYLATHDQLTNLNNRRLFDERLNDEVNRATRYNTTFSIFMIDIDHFKEVNDSYGHKVGDQLLKEFATLLNKFLRINDFVARYGGEEFTVILPETSAAEAFDLAERFRQQVENYRFEITEAGRYSFTISICISSFSENGTSSEVLIKTADEAMYIAKNSGRNNVVQAR